MEKQLQRVGQNAYASASLSAMGIDAARINTSWIANDKIITPIWKFDGSSMIAFKSAGLDLKDRAISGDTRRGVTADPTGRDLLCGNRLNSNDIIIVDNEDDLWAIEHVMGDILDAPPILCVADEWSTFLARRIPDDSSVWLMMLDMGLRDEVIDSLDGRCTTHALMGRSSVSERLRLGRVDSDSWRAHCIIHPQRDHINLMTGARHLNACKVHHYKDGEHVRSDAAPMIKHWRHAEVGVSSLEDVFEAIKANEDDPQTMIIRGKIKADVDPARCKRRKTSFDRHPHQWLMVDFDDIPAPFEVDPEDRDSLNEAARQIVAERLHPCFNGVSHVVQWSNSAGVKPWDLLRLHVWFWFDRPVSDDDMDAWYQREMPLADKSLTHSVQIHFTAKPPFIGIADPFPLRGAVLVKGERDSVTPPVFAVVEEPAIIPPEKRTYKASPKPSSGDREIPTKERGERCVRKALDAACSEISGLIDGVGGANSVGRNDGLNRIAGSVLRLQELPGSISAWRMQQELLSAAMSTGLSKSACEATLESANRHACNNLIFDLPVGDRRSNPTQQGQTKPNQAEHKSIEPPSMANHFGPDYHESYNDDWPMPMISDTILAERMLRTYTHPQMIQTDRQLVYAAGDLWRADLLSSLWVPITDHELGLRMKSWDSKKLSNGKLIGLNRNIYRNVASMLREVLLPKQDDFFDDVPLGFVAGGKFIAIDVKAKTITEEALTPQHKQRHSIADSVNVNADDGVYGKPGTLLNQFLSTIHKRTLTDEEEASFTDEQKADIQRDERDRLLSMGQVVFATLAHLNRVYKRAFFFYGPKGTGKSQMIEMLQALVPEAAQSSLSPQDIADERHVPGLNGVWLNALTEVEASFSETAKLKAAVMGEKIRANPKGKDAFDLRPRCVFLFAGNVLPKFHGGAIWDRFLPIKFDNRFRDSDSGRKEIKDIGKTIATTEAGALIEWALYCGRELMRNERYTVPQSAEEVFTEWREDSDPVECWVTDETEAMDSTVKKAWPTLADAHESYSDWSKLAGHKPMARRTFSKRLQDAGVEVAKSAGVRRVKVDVRSSINSSWP